MTYQMTPRIPLSVLAFLFSFSLLVYGIARYDRGEREQELLAFISAMGAISLTQISVVLGDLFTTAAVQLFWVNFTNAVGLFLVAYSFLWFALAYSGRDWRLDRRTGALVAGHIALNLVVVVLAPEFLYEVDGVASRGPYTVLGITFEQWVFIDRTLKLSFRLFQLYIYGIVVLTAIIFALYVLDNRPHLAGGQIATLTAGIGSPIVLNGLMFVGVVPPALNFTVMSLSVTSAAFAVAIFRYRLLTPAPVGRQQLVEMMDDPVAVLDSNGRVVDSNPAARGLVDAPSNWRDVPSETFFSPLSEQIDPTADRLPVDTTITVKDDGDTRYFDLSIAHIQSETAEILGVLIVLRDITGQYESRRRLEEKTEQLDKFINIVSHDLRSPLSVASGNVELLRHDRDDQRLETVADALDRMDELLEETLQIARQDEDVALQPVSLDSLAAESWAMIATDDETTLERPESVVIHGDPERIKTLFENLFRNAVEHNEQPVTVRVGAIDETRDGFYVEDDGSGIPEEKRDSVLEHGFSTRADGTGFGLSIVTDIAQAHNWEIRVTESGDGGARFEITGIEIAPRQSVQP
jgi:signal transduction histidine kinase